MTRKYELRSTSRGRPLGTFGEAAFRARSWFWLGEVMRRAETEDVTAIDKPTHPLSRGLSVGRRFEQVAQDGYDPDRITAKGNTSLASHVARKRGYESTLAAYRHAMWMCLVERVTPVEGGADLLRTMLRNLGMARLDLEDQSNAHALGLIPSDSLLSVDEELHLQVSLGRLAQLAEHPTLDGLTALILLYREANDLARDDDSQYLKRLLEKAATRFADCFWRGGEPRDTWVYLVQTRMLRWSPGFAPQQSDVDQAEVMLYEEWVSRSSSASRKVADPRTYARGRAERRWRRASWVRGCCLALERDSNAQCANWSSYLYVNSELGRWLAENRELISGHLNAAMHRLMAVDGSVLDYGRDTDSLPSIRMPKSLFETRSRPSFSEEEWRHFGRRLPYDIIPVEKS